MPACLSPFKACLGLRWLVGRHGSQNVTFLHGSRAVSTQDARETWAVLSCSERLQWVYRTETSCFDCSVNHSELGLFQIKGHYGEVERTDGWNTRLIAEEL